MLIGELTSRIKLHNNKVSLMDALHQPRLVRKNLEVPLVGDLHQRVLIGRDESIASLVIEDVHISRTHAAIVCEGGKFYLKDLNSKNGTFLNERRLAAGTQAPQPLQHGDRLRFNVIEFEFVVPEEIHAF